MLLINLLPGISAAETTECEDELVDIIRARDFGLAYYCSELRLAENPNDVNVLLVAARSAQELGQADIALNYAARARRLSPDDSQRFASFLISGMASASKGNGLAAKIFLRRGANLAQNDVELGVIGSAMAQARRQSPWSYSLGFNIDPSSNINGGSIFDGDGVFTFDDEAVAQPGIGYSLNTGVTYRTRISDRTIWDNTVAANGTINSGPRENTYNLSVKTVLRYQPETERPTLWVGSLSYNESHKGDELHGPVFSDYSLYYSQTSFRLERFVTLSRKSSLMLYGSYTWRAYETRGDAEIGKVGFSYRFPLLDNLSGSVSGFYEDTEAQHLSVAKEVSNIAIGLTLNLEDLPIVLSSSLSYTNTDYKLLSILQAPFGIGLREDETIGLNIGVTPKNLQWFGFRPTFGLNMSRNFSNAARFSTFEVKAYTRISSVF